MIDATETPIERPKNSSIFIPERRKTQYKNSCSDGNGEQKIICTSFSNGRIF